MYLFLLSSLLRAVNIYNLTHKKKRIIFNLIKFIFLDNFIKYSQRQHTYKMRKKKYIHKVIISSTFSLNMHNTYFIPILILI